MANYYLVSLSSKNFDKTQTKIKKWIRHLEFIPNLVCLDDDGDDDDFIRPLMEKSETNFTAEKNLLLKSIGNMSAEHLNGLLMDESSAGFSEFFNSFFTYSTVELIIWLMFIRSNLGAHFQFKDFQSSIQ